MSYSISARAATKAEVKTAIAAKFAEVVSTQPVHKADQEPALAAALADCGSGVVGSVNLFGASR